MIYIVLFFLGGGGESFWPHFTHDGSLVSCKKIKKIEW